MAEAEQRFLAVYRSRDGQEIKLNFDTVRKFLVSGRAEYVTDQEIMMFVGMCKARGLNPFKRDCYLVKYTERETAATIVSIDYYRSRAKAQEDCAGWNCGVIVKTAENKIEEREGSMVWEGEKLMGGWFRARPRGWEVDRYWSVPLDRYIKKTREGAVTQFWTEEKQPEMIVKVAESQGLRRTWPDEFAKLYVEEEIVEGVPLDVTAPLKTPQAINAPEETKEAKAEPKQAQRETKKHSDEAQQTADRKTKALDWISSVSDAEFVESRTWLNGAIKGLNQQEQTEICTAWNNRNRKIASELAAASKE